MSPALFILAALAVSVLAHIVFVVVARRRNPPIGTFVEAGGVRLHYIERGPADGPVLVLLHGNGAMIQELAISGLVDLAAQKNRVLCFDRPGFGYSSRPRWRLWTAAAQARVLAAALRALGARRPIVLGHSWGASVAVAMGRDPAVEAAGLVLVSGYYFPTARRDVWLLSGPAMPIIGDVMRYTIAPLPSFAILPALLRKIFSPAKVPRVFAQEFPRSLALRPSQLRAAAEESAFMVPQAAHAAVTYGALRCPVAIVAGDQDDVIERDQPARLHAMLPHSVLRTISGAGHMVHHTAPERVCDAVDLIRLWPRSAA